MAAAMTRRLLPLLLSFLIVGCGGRSGTTPAPGSPRPEDPELGRSALNLTVEAVSGGVRDTSMTGTGTTKGTLVFHDTGDLLIVAGSMGRKNEAGSEYLSQAINLRLPHVGELTAGSTFNLSDPSSGEYYEGLTWLLEPIAGDGMGRAWFVSSGTVEVLDPSSENFTLRLTDVVLSVTGGSVTETVKVSGTLSGPRV